MNQDIFDWLLLLGRWLHITTAVTWIGTSIFFMWLDRTFEFNAESKREGHVGDLWMVHGGGFYHVEKMLMGPTKVPDHLHWFKWESYWTWMSGLFLLVLIFYAGSGSFLLDSSVSSISYGTALVLAVFAVIGSWLFYDFLWESSLTKKVAAAGHTLTLLWVGGMAYFLCHTLSGRAAYMHIGAMLGTWMTANVFLRIIPRQVKMVDAAKKGQAVNQEWAKNAKNRSTHNTYFTLPVIFIMMSNHFPATYGHKLNWLILLMLGAAGAAIRHYFVIRLKNPPRAKGFLAAGIVLILATIGLSISRSEGGSAAESQDPAVNAAAIGVSLNAPPPAAPAGPVALVRGVVKFEGTPPKGDKLIMPPGCTSAHRDQIYSNEVIVKNGRLKNALAFISKGAEGKSYPVPVENVLLDQIDCLYEPRVVAARAGQKVEFINSDSIFHNVKSITKLNEEFNVAMPNKGDRMIKIFNKGEVALQTKCSVHPWMSASIAVMENPFYAISGDDGGFEIKDLPPGTYALEVWHEVFGTQTREITVAANQTQDLEFTFKKDSK